ncbi:hypothetical protein AALO_G00014480 [Alosa alosa]|uniref:Uncharacterized protein n=1 Tax=Alosa alosa TaxID=278164 RepID=A0AAV6HLM1_9TELE|nr:hypothetical protein AALO_G00014480 [Alosa alosa]
MEASGGNCIRVTSSEVISKHLLTADITTTLTTHLRSLHPSLTPPQAQRTPLYSELTSSAHQEPRQVPQSTRTLHLWSTTLTCRSSAKEASTNCTNAHSTFHKKCVCFCIPNTAKDRMN